MSKVMEVLLKHGKLTQAQYDASLEKDAAKKAAIEDYKKNKDKLTKAQLQAFIDTWVN